MGNIVSIAAYNVPTIGFWDTNKLKTPSLAIRKDGTTYYIPLISPNGYYDVPGTEFRLEHNGGKAIRVRYNGSTYVVPTSRVLKLSYDIPAGTYSPSAFENLIQSFISKNGSRRVSNSFSVEVNGQTYRVSSGSSIYYTYQYSGEARFVCFNGNPRGFTQFELPGAFAQHGIYCTHWSYSQQQGDRYYQYSIKVNTGIKFK